MVPHVNMRCKRILSIECRSHENSMPYHKGNLLYAKAAYAELKATRLTALVTLLSFSRCILHSLSMLSTVDSIVWGALWVNILTHMFRIRRIHIHTQRERERFSDGIHTATCFGIFVQHTHSNFISNLPIQFSSVLGKWTNVLLSNLIVIRLRSIHTLIFFFLVTVLYFISSLCSLFIHFVVSFKCCSDRNLFCVFCAI